MLAITDEQFPCWYELSWNQKKCAFLLRVSADFLESSDHIADFSPGIVELQEMLDLGEFEGNLRKNFGFENAFLRIGNEGEFIEFSVEIPELQTALKKNCFYCKGTGKNENLQSECYFCQGTGNEIIYERKKAYAISASFNAFFNLMTVLNKPTSSPLPQLMILMTATFKTDENACLMYGKIGKKLCHWFSYLGMETKFPESEKAMETALNRMLNLERFDKKDFHAEIEDDDCWLELHCPREDHTGICRVLPAGKIIKKRRGYDFISRGVDNPAEQIALLAGLAALHDKARKEISY